MHVLLRRLIHAHAWPVAPLGLGITLAVGLSIMVCQRYLRPTVKALTVRKRYTVVYGADFGLLHIVHGIRSQ